MDLESRVLNGTMSVYYCIIYDGTLINNLKYYNSIDEMLNSAIQS